MDNKRFDELMESVSALTDIDDALVSEALDAGLGAKRKRRLLPYFASAAAVLLVLGAAFAVIRLTGKPKPADITVMNPTDQPTVTSIPANATEGPVATDAPYATGEPALPSAPQTTGEPPASTEAPGTEPTSEPNITGSQEPMTTHAPEATERLTPKATGTPHATSNVSPVPTPKATGKPTPTPTEAQTASPTNAEPTGPDSTSEPVCFDFDCEEAFVSAIHAAGSGTVIGSFTHYYVPGALPDGAKLVNISVYDRDVIFEYSGGYELDWLFNTDPDDYLAQIQSHYNGHWEGGLYIAETGILRAFWKQDGQAFRASFPSDTDINIIKAFCAARRVNV